MVFGVFFWSKKSKKTEKNGNYDCPQALPDPLQSKNRFPPETEKDQISA